MKWSWYYVATFVERDYGAYVDWEEEFFECPECGEPIYKCDYPYIDLGMVCPVCEFMSENEEDEVKESDDMDCPNQKETGDE